MGANMRKIISILLSILLIVTINQTNVLAEDNVIPKDSKGIEYQVYSPEFPDAYIIINEKPRKMRASTFNVLSNSNTLNEVTATVFVEEEYDVVDGENVIIKSKLLSKDEVMNLGVNNFQPLRVRANNIKTRSNTRGKLTIKLSGKYSIIGSGVTLNLVGSANWADGLNLFGRGNENLPAPGEDFIGVTWSGGFTVKSSSISGKNHLGNKLNIYESDSVPNSARVWSFNDLIRTSKYSFFAKDINLNMNLHKNRRTGNGNTAEAVLKYIHTYSGVKGTISISAGSGGISGGFSLSNIEKQWSIVCTVTGIPY